MAVTAGSCEGEPVDEKTKKYQNRKASAPKVSLATMGLGYNKPRKKYNLMLIDSFDLRTDKQKARKPRNPPALKSVNSIQGARRYAYQELANHSQGASWHRYAVKITDAYTDEEVMFAFIGIYDGFRRFVVQQTKTDRKGKARRYTYALNPDGSLGDYLQSVGLNADGSVKIPKSRQKPAPAVTGGAEHFDLPEPKKKVPKYKLWGEGAPYGDFSNVQSARIEICKTLGKRDALSVVKADANGDYVTCGTMRIRGGKFVWIQKRNGVLEAWVTNPSDGSLTVKFQ